MKVINTLPKNNFRIQKGRIWGTVWGQHLSAYKLDNVIQPQSYETLGRLRNKNYDIAKRMNSDEEYHRLLNSDDKTRSFVYAAVVGFNKMNSLDRYPGFTYFFRLADQIIEESLFGIINKSTVLDFKSGFSGLVGAIRYWRDNEMSLMGNSRVEIISPINIEIEYYFPQEEDR